MRDSEAKDLGAAPPFRPMEEPPEDTSMNQSVSSRLSTVPRIKGPSRQSSASARPMGPFRPKSPVESRIAVSNVLIAAVNCDCASQGAAWAIEFEVLSSHGSSSITC